MLRPPLRRSDLLGRGDHLNLEGVLIRVRTTLKSLVEMRHKTLGQLAAVEVKRLVGKTTSRGRVEPGDEVFIPVMRILKIRRDKAMRNLDPDGRVLHCRFVGEIPRTAQFLGSITTPIPYCRMRQTLPLPWLVGIKGQLY